MPTCNVIGCKGRKNRDPNLTLHRLPLNEKKKKQWLDMIGEENLNFKTKFTSICSLHFDKSCFNRTLNITKLRDDAIPSKYTPPQLTDNSVSSNEQTQDPLTITNENNGLTEDRKISIISEDPLYVKITHIMDSNSCTKMIPDPDLQVQTKKDIIIHKLKVRCECQRKTIKRLQLMVRRQKNKIANFLSMVHKMKGIKRNKYTDHTYT